MERDPKYGAVLLCGGGSRRMGRAKALLPWRGKTMLEYVIDTLATVTDQIVVVGAPGLTLPDLGSRARVVEDRVADKGPLAGIREGLEACPAEFAFVTATDAPFLTAEFVRYLLSFDRAVAPEVDGYVQSLTAVYPTAAAATAADLLARDRGRPLFLLEACDYLRVGEAELPSREPFRNLNNPDAYLAAVQVEEGAATAEVEFLGTTRSRADRATLTVPIGTVQQAVESIESQCPAVSLREGGALAPHYLLSFDGREFVRSLAAPLGPGERLLVMDAAAGG
ncbi:MAG: molybdenum cofactor guanylyltransferase [Planctomycetota bacterium]